MKGFLWILVLATIGEVYAQMDSAMIFQIYSDFETTIQSKDQSSHLNLYADNRALVGIVRKYPTGPDILGYINAQTFTNGWGNNPYELRISDIHLQADSGFAITDAHFDEYINGNKSAFGRDMFGYIRTMKGWKLLFLHNTVIFNSDTTDYTTPFTLPNTVEDVMNDFETNFDLHSSLFYDLFFRADAQVISFENELDSNYRYHTNEVRDFYPGFIDSSNQEQITFDNVQIYYVDDYLASVFSDYSIHEDGVLIESGRSYINLMGTMQNGWQITSWIRNQQPIVSTGIMDEVKSGELEVYPNPVTDMATIHLGDKQVDNWQLLNAGDGRVIKTGNKLSGEMKMDVSDLPTGVYIFHYTAISESIEEGTIRFMKN